MLVSSASKTRIHETIQNGTVLIPTIQHAPHFLQYTLLHALNESVAFNTGMQMPIHKR